MVQLVVEEPESVALGRYLADGPVLATSRIALVEMPRATGLANPAPEVQGETEQLLASCVLVDVTDGLLRAAASHACASVRTLDAIHLASALWIEANELVAYDRRLAAVAGRCGLAASSPGAPGTSS